MQRRTRYTRRKPATKRRSTKKTRGKKKTVVICTKSKCKKISPKTGKRLKMTKKEIALIKWIRNGMKGKAP